MEGAAPPSDDASEALGGAAPQDERTSLLFTDGARSGRATARLSASSAAASFGAARAGRLSVRIPRGTLSGAAQAVPARLAWSPDPAWSTPSQAAPSRQEPRKRARQGHVVAARQTPAESDGGFGSSDAAAGGGWWQPSGEDQYFFSDNSDADVETDSDSVSVRALPAAPVALWRPAVTPNCPGRPHPRVSAGRRWRRTSRSSWRRPPSFGMRRGAPSWTSRCQTCREHRRLYPRRVAQTPRTWSGTAA